MPKIVAPRLNVKNLEEMSQALQRWSDRMTAQLNNLSEDRLQGHYAALTAAPTGGTYAIGDFVTNSNPSEAGSASSKYVIIGWVCTVAGSPGTWLECRCLTGN